ncbi:hypothetical protein NW752_009823 [Fusarium irregulare]|nr:hypothetical protein NW752_009823 [Fusarium irregulare]
MDSSNERRPSTASLDQDFRKSLSTYAVLQNLRDDLRHHDEDIAECLDILIGGVDVTASEIESEEQIRSFDARTGLSTHQLGNVLKHILSGRIRDWNQGWEQARASRNPPFDLPVPGIVKSDIISMIETHYLACQDSTEMFLSDAWMESAFGRQLTHSPYLGKREPLVTWDDVRHFLSVTHRPKFEKSFSNFASALPLQYVEAIPALLHAGAVLEYWHKEDRQGEDRQGEDQQDKDKREEDQLAKAITCLSGPALDVLPMSRLQSVSSLRESLPVVRWKIQKRPSNSTRSDSGLNLRILRTIPVYRSLNDADSDDDFEMTDDVEYARQPAKREYWTSEFVYSLQEKLPGWNSKLTETLLRHIISQPGCAGMSHQLRKIQEASRNEYTDEARLASFLRGPLIFAAKCGFMTRSGNVSSPGFCVEEILRLHRQQKIKLDMFDRIMSVMVSNDGTMGVSYIPGVIQCGDNKGKLSEIFRPLMSPTDAHGSKTIIIRGSEPRIACMAICEVRKKKQAGRSSALCEAVLFHALGDSKRDTTDKKLLNFRSEILNFLEKLFPSNAVSWAWWDEGEAQVAIRESIVIDSSRQGNRPQSAFMDPALQLLDVCCRAFTPHRFSALGKLMGHESLLIRNRIDSDSTESNSAELIPLTLTPGCPDLMILLMIARQITQDAARRFEGSKYDKSYWESTRSRRQLASSDDSPVSERQVGDSGNVDEEVELLTGDIETVWNKVSGLENVLRAQEEDGERKKTVKLPDVLFNRNDMDNDEKVQKRINELLDVELQTNCHYSETVDATIDAASPLLKDKLMNRTDEVETLLRQYRDRWSDLLFANARICLSMTEEEGKLVFVSPNWWRVSVANAKKRDRERLCQRFLNPKNHPLHMQMVMAQGIWSKDMFLQLSGPIDTASPGYDGSAFNTAYLIQILFGVSDKPMGVYFGSATGPGGEGRRMQQHEETFSQTSSEVRQLANKGMVLFVHTVGASDPEAQRSSYALARFPKTDADGLAAIHSRQLAWMAEQLFLTMAHQLNNVQTASRHNEITARMEMSGLLLEYFAREARLPRTDPAFSIRVLNRAYPMLQHSHHQFGQTREEVDTYAAIRDALDQFFAETRKRHITPSDIRQIYIDHNLDTSFFHSGNWKFVQNIYKDVLGSYSERYQGPHDDLLFPAVAGVIRHAFRAGIITAPDSNDSTELYSINSASIDWHEATLDAREVVPEDLVYLCTPAKIRDLWYQSIRSKWGVAQLALIPRNTQFFRGENYNMFLEHPKWKLTTKTDDYSMDQDVILAYRLLSTPMSKYLTQLCRSQFVEYFGSQREGEPDVVFVSGVSTLSPPYHYDRHDIAPKIVAQVLRTLSSEAESQLDTPEFQQVQTVDYLDLHNFLFAGEQPHQEEPASLEPAHLKIIVEELEECGPKQLTSEQLSDITRIGHSTPRVGSGGTSFKPPKKSAFLLKRSIQAGDALGFLFRPMSLQKKARKMASVPEVKENMTCEEYITIVHSAFSGDRVNREHRGNWKEEIIDRQCELPLLLALSKSRRDGNAVRDTSLILNQVSEEHGVTIRESADTKNRRVAVSNLIARVFVNEPYLKQLATGLSPWLSLTSKADVYEVFREYICSISNQNPLERVDVRVWTDGNDSVKPTCAKVAADLAQRLEAASGLVDANIHISRKTIEDNVRGDKFEKLENDFLEKLK